MGRAPALALALLAPLWGGGVAQDSAPSTKPTAPSALRSFQSVSRLIYASAPDRPHSLTTTYVLPDRVRWQTSDKGDTSRKITWRRGDQLYALDPGASSSTELSKTVRGQRLAQMELRRALFCWPDGFEWRGDGKTRSANLGALGTLRAQFAAPDDPQPSEIGDYETGGRARDAYKKIVWREQAGRMLPSKFELWHSGELVWTETVESIDLRGRYLEAFFLPPDHPPTDGPRAGAAPRVEEVDLPAVCGRRFELAQGGASDAWARAVIEVEALRAVWEPKLSAQGLALEPRATVELGKDLRPKACVLRLTQVPSAEGAVPEGFATTPAGKAVAIAVSGPDQVSSKHLKLLAAKAPKNAQPREAYVQFDLAEPVIGTAVFVLPFVPE